MDDVTNPEADLARLQVRLEEALAERDLARSARRRAEEETHRVELELSVARTDLNAVQSRLAERETYLRKLHASRGWKALQALRNLFGRRW